MSDFSFDAPTRLWVLMALALAGAAAGWFLLHRRSSGEQFAEPELVASVAPHRAGWRRPVAAAGLVLATVALTTAFARPQVVLDQEHERSLVVVALDTSTSMMLTDVAPDRFTAAKIAAKDFIRDLPEDIDVALVSYHSIARVIIGASADHERVAAAVDDLTMAGGTALGDALLTSLQAARAGLGTADLKAAHIVLLADGDSTMGTPVDVALPQVLDAGVPVSTIAFGTSDTPVPVNTDQLAQIAQVTGGTAHTATAVDELRDVYDEIATTVIEELELVDISDVFAGIGLALLFATAVPSLFWFSRLA